MNARARLCAVVLAASAATAACGGGSPTSSGTTGGAAPSETGTAPSHETSTASAGPSPSCSAPGSMPAGAASTPMPDVDGDGTADTLWISSDGVHRTVGLSTSTGATFSQPIDSASPIPIAALAFEVRPDAGVDVVVSDGRLATLYAVAPCSLAPVIGPDGKPFRFDLGFTGNGTGMGCAEVDGRRELVGLLADPADGTVNRTVITLDDGHARIGQSVTVPADAAALELAHQVTCGDLALKEDGAREPRA